MRTKLDFETVKGYSFFNASDLEEGKCYQYKENRCVINVIYNHGYIDSVEQKLVLNLTSPVDNESFDISVTTDPKYRDTYYNGMFRIYDAETHMLGYNEPDC